MNAPSDNPLAAVLRFGDARLWQPSEQVETPDDVLAAQAEQMQRTIHAHRAKYGWGRAIAAPQIGIMRQIVCMAVDGQEHVLINPEVTWASDTRIEVWDDCMSLPEITVRVLRHENVTVQYQMPDGTESAFERAPFA